MKRILLLLLLVNFIEAKDIKEIMKEYTNSWQPLAVDLNEGVLIIPLNQSTITNKIYSSIMLNGVCLSTYSEKWQGVKQIVITNKNVKQGYVFSGGYNECKKVLANKRSNIILLSKSRQL
jgi:hypothetical protein